LLADGTYYVIDAGDRIVAAGGWSARQTLFGGDQMKAGDDVAIGLTMPARIRAFFVDPDWTRRGLARRLYDACEAAARERGFQHFELMATLPGVPLYHALGFMDLERVDVPMPDGLVLPCLRMGRAL
jgi:GNAT superfamily N-acetyltransferase